VFECSNLLRNQDFRVAIVARRQAIRTRATRLWRPNSRQQQLQPQLVLDFQNFSRKLPIHVGSGWASAAFLSVKRYRHWMARTGILVQNRALRPRTLPISLPKSSGR
jgi:hypothetical protein